MTVKELLRRAYAAGEERKPGSWDDWWLTVGVNLQIEFLHPQPPEPVVWVSENGARRLRERAEARTTWPLNVSTVPRPTYPCPVYLEPADRA